MFPSDIEIARKAKMIHIKDIAEKLSIPEEALHQYGHHIAKIDKNYVESIQNKPNGKLILVTAITPTPAGEGKTTTTVGLGDGLSRIGKNAMICLREPSLGPCFGMKGGAAGGGYAQVVPMEDINLHFTGDFHAIGSAHNLLSAMIDNHIHWENSHNIDVRRITWKRVMDMNDRNLRYINIGLNGPGNGFPREDGFDITVASEIMAIFCLVRNLKELEERLGKIIIGYSRDKKPIRAEDLNAQGAMAVLLKNALQPNLVQTLENTPAFIHGGPFANIAHGCNSVIATQSALKMADYVITEAGFGADLGAEKFFDIKCRKAGLTPDAVVMVVTVKALKMHGNVALKDIKEPNLSALKEGLCNLGRHLDNLKKFGVPVVVGINQFTADSDEEHQAIKQYCESKNVNSFLCNHWAEGGKGTEDISHHIVDLLDNQKSNFQCLYDDDLLLFEKIEKIAIEIYGATDVSAPPKVRQQLKDWEAQGYRDLPICMAKTQYSFSTNPALKGAPHEHNFHVREVRLGAGAGFIVAICGETMTMPGLPRKPAATQIGLDDDGNVVGLF